MHGIGNTTHIQMDIMGKPVRRTIYFICTHRSNSIYDPFHSCRWSLRLVQQFLSRCLQHSTVPHRFSFTRPQRSCTEFSSVDRPWRVSSTSKMGQKIGKATFIQEATPFTNRTYGFLWNMFQPFASGKRHAENVSPSLLSSHHTLPARNSNCVVHERPTIHTFHGGHRPELR